MINRKRTTLLTLVVVSVILLFIAYSIFVSIRNTGKSVVVVSVAPKDAKLLLDQTKYIKSGNDRIAPGNHVIKASRVGFVTEEQHFIVSKDVSNVVLVALTPNSNVGTTYLNNHQNEFIKIGDLGEQQNNRITAVIIKQYPIVNHLPADLSPLFTINYGKSKKYPNDPTKIAIYISAANPANRQSALLYFFSMGYDPSNYEIVFQNLVHIESGD